MLSILVPLSCEIVGTVKPPETPSIDFPVSMFPATQSDTFVSDTVPPEVYPAGIVTVPALVPIVPDVLPLFAMLPEMDPVDP